MNRYSLTHLSDPELLRNLADVIARDRSTTAALLAHLAEVEARKLYLPAGYPSMHAYCVGELRMSEDVACDRIQAAQTAREFPAIFTAIADGRLNLTGVLLLAPALTPENWRELLNAAEHKSKREIEQFLAERVRQAAPRIPELPIDSPEVESLSDDGSGAPEPALSVPERITSPAPRFPVHALVDEETRDMLGYAQMLLSHQVPSGDMGKLLRKLLEIAIPRLEKRKFGGRTTGVGKITSNDPRYIPMRVKSAVWLRDGGQCTFVSETGKRCQSCRLLEFDHIVEVARGGASTVENVRLRCRAHNQYTAEQTFGTGFMKEKRASARAAASKPRAASAVRQDGAATAASQEASDDRDVIPWLRTLGYRADQARRAAEYCEQFADASLEDRLKAALRFLMPPHRVERNNQGAKNEAQSPILSA